MFSSSITVFLYNILLWLSNSNISSKLKKLEVRQIIDFIITEWNGEWCLPSNYINFPPNRAWVWNVGNLLLQNHVLVNTLKQEGFREFIKEIMLSREEHFLKKRNLILEMAPKIASIFANSHSSSGTAFWLIFLYSWAWKISQIFKESIAERSKGSRRDWEKNVWSCWYNLFTLNRDSKIQR